jgi:hypothetical protein
MTTETAFSYHRCGFVIVPAVVDKSFIAACIAHLHQLQAAQRHAGSMVTAPLATDSFLRSVAGDPRFTEIAGCLLGVRPVPFGCTYFVKEPHCGLPVLWHQDGYPWRTQLGIDEAVTLWLALDRSDEDTGGLQVIPGSHALLAQPLQPQPAPPSVFGYQLDAALVDPTLARTVALAPGDLSAHHPNLIHGSPANRSAHPRRGLAIRYQPGEAASS